MGFGVNEINNSYSRGKEGLLCLPGQSQEHETVEAAGHRQLLWESWTGT